MSDFEALPSTGGPGGPAYNDGPITARVVAIETQQIQKPTIVNSTLRLELEDTLVGKVTPGTSLSIVFDGPDEASHTYVIDFYAGSGGVYAGENLGGDIEMQNYDYILPLTDAIANGGPAGAFIEPRLDPDIDDGKRALRITVPPEWSVTVSGTAAGEIGFAPGTAGPTFLAQPIGERFEDIEENVRLVTAISESSSGSIGAIAAQMSGMDTYSIGRPTTTHGTVEMTFGEPLSTYVAAGTTLTIEAPEYAASFTLDFYSLGAGEYVGENIGIDIDAMIVLAFNEIRSQTTGFVQFQSAADQYTARVQTPVGISHVIGGTAAAAFGLETGAFGPTVEVVNLAGRFEEVDTQIGNANNSIGFLSEQVFNLETALVDALARIAALEAAATP